MKILVLYQSPWWNAAAYYAFNLVLSLKRLGYEVIFIAKKDTPIAERIISDQINLIDLNLFENNPIKFIGNINKVKKIIIDQNIDYLIPISAPSHIMLGIAKLFFGIKLPIVKVCLDNVPPIKNTLNRYLHNKLTDHFIFPGQSTKIKYKSFTINNFSIIHAPLDVIKFTDFYPKENLKSEFGIPLDKTIVSFIGRFSPEKGIFFLLDIIKTVTKKSDNTFFILSGSEEQVKFVDVQNKIDELQLTDKIKIINKVNDVRKIISITNIGLLSSRYSEFICRIAMEFMSFKVPIVAPRVNVIPEVVGSDENGFIYEATDYNQAANYLLGLINDKNLLDRMGNNSYNRILSKYDVEVFDNEIKSILENIK